jgi:T3SS negative regulator,GrlR
MLSGVYRVCFRRLSEAGKGIIYAKDGRIVGGDSWYVYGGIFDIAGDWVSATIHVINDEPSSCGIFGSLTDFIITVSGRDSRRGFEPEGSPEGHPRQRFFVQGTKLGDA